MQFVSWPCFQFRIHVERAAAQIDDRRAGNADNWRHIVAVWGKRRTEINLPICDARRIRVKRIDAVGFRADKNHIVHPAGQTEVRDVKRLSKDLAVHSVGKELAKSGRINVGRRQNGLCRVGPGSGNIVVLGEHIHPLCRRLRPAQQFCRRQ